MAEQQPIVIGPHSYCAGSSRVSYSGGAAAPHAKLIIGKFCSIADGFVALLDGEHNTDWVSTYPFGERGWCPPIAGHPKSFGNIEIGNDVWIGMNVTLLSGTTVGNGAVIAAGSYVRGKVPAYSIYGGSPARLLTMRFHAETVEKLQGIAWWDWPEERIKKAIPYLSAGDVWKFLEGVEGEFL